MTKPESVMNLAQRAILFVILISSFVITSIAQDSPPPAEKRGVQLMFLPPPMQGGTISLGIYDPAGKLVRVLHQEAQTSDFFAALNGFITYWDGKDDTGKLMPAGKYFARGYMVGPMDFDGVAMLGNDWITVEDSPRIEKILDIACDTEGNLQMLAQQRDNTFLRVRCDVSGNITKKQTVEKLDVLTIQNQSWLDASGVLPRGALRIENRKIFMYGDELKIPSLNNPVDACLVRKNKEGWLWVIDCSNEGTYEIKQFSPTGEFKRHLVIPPNDPAPVKIAASQTSDTIYLLETKSGMQRVRGLTLLSGTTDIASPAQSPEPSPAAGSLPKSTWKVTFSKSIRSSDTIDQVRDLLKTASGKPFAPQDKIRLTLLPNPLEQDKLGAVDISIGVDAKGSFLKAGDGLPLCRVSETPNLRWAAMSGEPGSKVITLFQGDGAVVEQFKAGRLANMMSFDCGDFDFDPAKVK